MVTAKGRTAAADGSVIRTDDGDGLVREWDAETRRYVGTLVRDEVERSLTRVVLGEAGFERRYGVDKGFDDPDHSATVDLVADAGGDRSRSGVDVGEDPIQLAAELGVDGVEHSHSPCVARVAARYVTAAISMPLRWLQRRAWTRRAAVHAPRPSGARRGGGADA